MHSGKITNEKIAALIKNGTKLPLAMENYPSRGQTAIQELYQTDKGKLFLKRVSARNHEECQIDVKSGTLAEREFWACSVANAIGLFVPQLWLLDNATTVQIWLDYPDGKTYKKSTGKMPFSLENIFNCVLFDWITGQIDRHDANYLYDYTKQTIIPVDSAHGFLKYEGALPDYLHLFEIGEPKKLTKKIMTSVKYKLDRISDSELVKLAPLRNEHEINALLTRKHKLLKVHKISDLLSLYRGEI